MEVHLEEEEGGGEGSTTTTARATATATFDSQVKVRIHVGGLGTSVTEEDLRNIFSTLSLGEIVALDIVRSKGRSFAYFDFLPSSPNSLPKLFNTYNGCRWKGGRLRLEKAKEDYLARLKREWSEDSVPTATTTPDGVVPGGLDVEADAASSHNTNHNKKILSNKLHLSSENKKLRMFFPRLGKVKSIPFSGSGKHKYSFRRVDVPSLPVYFCDCEEHAPPPYDCTSTQQATILHPAELGTFGGIDEKERQLMTSVMNRIFGRENAPNPIPDEMQQDSEVDSPMQPIDDLQLNDHQGDTSESEDNLIINIVSQRHDTLVANQESRQKRQSSLDRPAPSALKKQKSNTGSPNKKKKNKDNDISSKSLDQHEDAAETESVHFASNLPKGEENLHTRQGDIRTHLRPLVVKANQRASAPTVLWSQKSSWRALVGNEDNREFSISKILPGVCPSEEKESRSNNVSTEVQKLIGNRKHKDQLDRQKVVKGPAESPGVCPNEEEGSRSNNVSTKVQNLIRHEKHKDQLGSPKLVKGPAESPGICPNEEDESRSKNGSTKVQNLIEYKKHEDEPDSLKVVEGPAESQPIEADSRSKSGRGSAWIHKSSWTELVAVNNSSSFSFGQLIPDVSLKTQEPEPAVPGDIEHGNVVEDEKSRHHVDAIQDLEHGKEASSQNPVEMIQQSVLSNKEAPTRPVERKHASATKQACPLDAVIGQTCSFMRTSASLKEWANTKAALSGSQKKEKKNNENRGS